MSSPPERLVAQLAGIKELSGLSLRALAREAGLSSSSLSRYLTGRLVPPWEAVVALCRVVRRDPRPLRAIWTEATQAGPAPAPRRNDLPADLFDFTGREEESAQVEELLRTVGAVAVDGMAGVGKTSLALHVAHRLAPSFPDGGLYLDLQGFTPGQEPLEPQAALARLLAGLDVTHLPAGTAERAALWRSELSRRRALVLLDNAADADQARPLLPGAGPSAVLITSRNRLVSLDGVPPVTLTPLGDDDAARLFGRAAGLAPAPAGRDADAEGAAVEQVLRLCGGLPLALRMAGARLRHRPGWTVAVLAERLRDSAGRFDAVFGMSLQQLDPAQRRLFRLLGVLPGADFDAGVAAALDDQPVDDLLDELVDAHLLQETAPGRYRMHDLIRRYAADLAAEEEPKAGDALRRVVTHYLARAVDHDRILPAPGRDRPESGDPAAAMAWFDLEYVNLVAAFDAAVRLGADEVVAGLPQTMRVWFFRHRGTDDQSRMLTAAADACRRLGRHRERSALLADLGFAYAAAGRLIEALKAYEKAGATDPPGDTGRAGPAGGAASGDELAAALALRIGFVYRDLGDSVSARRHLRRARQLFEQGGQRGGQAQALAAEGWVTLQLGDRDEAAALARASVALADGPGRITGLVTLGVALAADEPAESRRVLGEALSLAEEHHLPHNQALCHNAAGIALRTAGAFAEALDRHRLALRLLRPLNEVQLEIDCLQAYAETCRAAGRPEEARPLLDRIIGLARELGRPYDEERARRG
ncbi:ATP-binding protein [Paractinoplanes toevensis]|uniref:ATP-binding protein n=1 Tax=Paractinoplanes toevensis TaxID=571911 RepID=UPI001FEB260C|nr:tetratricopeptide repeat protein [Actinoplanes toevensis]